MYILLTGRETPTRKRHPQVPSSPLTSEEIAELKTILSAFSEKLNWDLGVLLYDHLPNLQLPRPNGYDVGLNLKSLISYGLPGSYKESAKLSIEARCNVFHQQYKNLLKEYESFDEAIMLRSNNYTNKRGSVSYAERKNCINFLMEYERYSINQP